jgi:hypothetical protein
MKNMYTSKKKRVRTGKTIKIPGELNASADIPRRKTFCRLHTTSTKYGSAPVLYQNLLNVVTCLSSREIGNLFESRLTRTTTAECL